MTSERQVPMSATSESLQRLRVYWQPHCSSCAFVKQYLTRNGIDYESINVLEHANAY
jgi:glutaredoxin